MEENPIEDLGHLAKLPNEKAKLPNVIYKDTNTHIEEGEERESERKKPPAPPPVAPHQPTKPRKIKEDLLSRADRVQTTPSQHQALVDKLGDDGRVQKCYKILSEWKIGKGKGYSAGDYLVITKWVVDALEENERKVGKFVPKGMDYDEKIRRQEALDKINEEYIAIQKAEKLRQRGKDDVEKRSADTEI